MAKTLPDKEQDEGVGLVIKSVGLRWYHPGGFVVDRPQGLPDWTFVQWLTPTYLKTGDKSVLEAPGGCIFYPPGVAQWYGADIFAPFCNNWFHFNGPAVEPLMRELAIPLNQAIRLRNDDFTEPYFRAFLGETMSERRGRRQALSARAIVFLVEFGRILAKSAEKSQSVRNIELREKFEQFRERLREQCTETWTLAKMAAELHLSPSRFSNLYREFFDAKPVDDLIRMRLELARYYLRSTVMPVSYIANLCGFADTYYFSRMFKAKMGMTATAFRSDEEL